MVSRGARSRALAGTAVLAGALAAGMAPASRAAEPVGEQQAHTIAVDAYLYFYPLVTMDLTRRQLTNGGPAATPI